ncbi:hypothetical protein EHQ68_08290 [Leptospira congkakensis]|uniref:Lipoprotein n=1 Tax=Leptospira congkakensis TaxID=2484932 RepID=A0A4Z1AAL2_9LEPT|nr:hypothetical protein [Leptospira congkakensis]TGL88630.1 hypothetical protein EHQ69_14360 [Leptospira congkakensis]TGL89216.1 hypothetical protein EHQ68_08290 [Leptospira congkakensis]TGL97184.1 hypothetical protein EHQ70_07785 [Leptospira congkakensis]
MHRILLILFICFSVGCTNHRSYRQITFEKKDYQTNKRLPFIGTICSPGLFFPKNEYIQYSLIQIWEDGEFRISNLWKEPFDAIEDLRIYHSPDYIWMFSFIPLFSKYDCDKYHVTGYLLYLDEKSKQKLNKKLQTETIKTPSDLPMMVVREYRLMDADLLSQKRYEQREVERKTDPRYHKESFQLPKVWDPKPKSEIVNMPNERLIDYCLEFPYECVTDPNYLGEIRFRSNTNQKKNLNPSDFSSSFLTKTETTTNQIYFGCYCRKKPDQSIYSICPIDNSGLDSVCKSKNDCLERTNGEGQKLCHKKFKEDLSILMKTKESKDAIHKEKDNFDRMIFYTKKLWALETLKELNE